MTCMQTFKDARSECKPYSLNIGTCKAYMNVYLSLSSPQEEMKSLKKDTDLFHDMHETKLTLHEDN